jgi:hypothetical protein
MKTQKNKSQRLYLQTKNKRWKWMAGATAATAAGVTASQASTITINLLNNYISATGGNHLNVDLTGDGQPDLTIANSFFFSHHYATTYGATFYRFAVRVELNGVIAYGRDNGEYPSGSVQLGSQHGFHSGNYGTFSLTGSIPIFFKDLHINNGALTKGSLEVTVQESRVQLNSFAYNTPDRGSSLALLAMGAGGVLALRRWRATQERS